MRTKYIDLMEGLRPPAKEEITCISRHMRTYYGANSRQTKTFAVMLSVVGTAMVIGGLTGAGPVGTVSGAVCLLTTAFAFHHVFSCKRNLALFETGRFQVLDGFVNRIQACPEQPGVSSVEFVSDIGQVYDGWFEVRNEGLDYGSPLLLVYIPEKTMKGRRFLWAFTPFMLTEEGAKKHR